MSLEEQLSLLVTPSLEALGYELVRVMVQGKQRMTVQFMAERRDEKAMSVEDCATISRTISALLDVDDPIQGAYSLEVSSPGIDRPLTRLKDYTRFAGFETKIELNQPIEGRRKVRGIIVGIKDNEQIKMKVNDEEISFAFAEVKNAKLVLTDQLIAAATQEQLQ
jgi:ribosome maturation factor RimP